MSTVKTTNIAHPSSGSNNVVLAADGSATIESLNSTTIVGTTVRGGITSGTAQSATGTAVDFTGIPSWVKRITVMFDKVSLSGTSSFLFQVGTSAGVVTTGYSGGGMRYGVSSNVGATFTAGLGTINTVAAALHSGHIIWTNVSGDIWSGSANLGATSSEFGAIGASSVSLSGTLDRIRITTVNGTDTFDAGTINILYEG